MSPQPGEVWLADLGLAAKTRPVVIVSRFDPNSPRALILYVPLTTQNRSSRYEVVLPKLPFLDRDSVANANSPAAFFPQALRGQGREVAEAFQFKRVNWPRPSF